MREGALEKKKILVVDDEDQILKFMKEMFEPRGYSVTCVANGNEALKIIGSSPIDLLLLDLNLPGVSGVDVLKIVRQSAPRLKVVVLTALDGLRDPVERIGCEAFLPKPFDLEELGQVIKNVLAGKVIKEAKPAEDLIPACRILVVDDEKDIADFIQEDLTSEPEKFGFQVDVAYSADQGLEKAKKVSYDIALIDIKLERGSMWGGELIEELKKLSKPPVGFIVITAVDSEKQRSVAKQFPDYPVFDKPMNMDHLKETIRKICFKHKLVRKASARKA